jgi:hypothetical protein
VGAGEVLDEDRAVAHGCSVLRSGALEGDVLALLLLAVTLVRIVGSNHPPDRFGRLQPPKDDMVTVARPAATATLKFVSERRTSTDASMRAQAVA